MTLSDHIGKQRINIKQHRVFKADFRSVGFKITEFLRIFQNAPIVMVTHSQHDAGFAGRIINLFDGQVVTEANL